MRFKAEKFARTSLPFILLGVVFAASGCDQLDPTYYTRPESPGYTQRVFKNVCPVCNETYAYSQEEWDKGNAFKCPLHRKQSLFHKEEQEQAQAMRDIKDFKKQNEMDLQAMKAQQQSEMQRLKDELRRAKQP